MSSFKKIDYSLRPAKHAERRMLAETFKRLRPFGPVQDYHYVGLGSVWFSDFVLFHRSLGVKRMTSFEKHVAAKDRFEANKPFAINVVYKAAGAALEELDWTGRHIIWLDYDDPLLAGMLDDVRYIAGKAASGTVLVVSTQCTQAVEVGETEKEQDGVSAIDRFNNRFPGAVVEAAGDEPARQPSEEDLDGWLYGSLSRSIIRKAIADSLSTRNLEAEANAVMQQAHVCDIEYADGAKMSSVVVLFHSAQDAPLVADCGFDNLDFLSAGQRTVRINMPNLTIKELRTLEAQLPLAPGAALDLGGTIPKGDADKFAGMYRYFPNFAVTEA